MIGKREKQTEKKTKKTKGYIKEETGNNESVCFSIVFRFSQLFCLLSVFLLYFCFFVRFLFHSFFGSTFFYFPFSTYPSWGGIGTILVIFFFFFRSDHIIPSCASWNVPKIVSPIFSILAVLTRFGAIYTGMFFFTWFAEKREKETRGERNQSKRKDRFTNFQYVSSTNSIQSILVLVCFRKEMEKREGSEKEEKELKERSFHQFSIWCNV